MPPTSSRHLGLPLLLLALAAGCERASPTRPSPPPCVYTLSATSLSFAAPGGSEAVSVSTASQCSWTARTEASWLSITSGAAGTGPGTVTIAAASNPATSERNGTIAIAEQPVAVRQDGLAACTYQISPAAASFEKEGGDGSFTVNAPEHCQWTVASQASWLTITSGGAGAGNGSVAYRADRNTALADRSGIITVADLTFSVTQAGDVESCQYSVAPVTFTPCMTSGDLSSTITTEPGCPWTASPGAPWITVIQGETDSGAGVVSFRVSDNWEAPREGVVMVRWPAPTLGQNLRISQAGCHYAVTRDAFSFGPAGGTDSFDVLQQSDPIACGGPLQNACMWTAESDAAWITITTGLPRTGDHPLSFTVAANDGLARSGTIKVRDRTVRISQAGQ
jgi:hypothetical protein